MYCEIDAFVGQRLFNFFGKHSFGADLHKRCMLHAIARRDQNLNRDLVTAIPQLRGDVICLPAGKGGAATPNADQSKLSSLTETCFEAADSALFVPVASGLGTNAVSFSICPTTDSTLPVASVGFS